MFYQKEKTNELNGFIKNFLEKSHQENNKLITIKNNT